MGFLMIIGILLMLIGLINNFLFGFLIGGIGSSLFYFGVFLVLIAKLGFLLSIGVMLIINGIRNGIPGGIFFMIIGVIICMFGYKRKYYI